MLSMNAKNTIKRMKEIKILSQLGVVLSVNHQIGFSFFLTECIYLSVLYIQFKFLVTSFLILVLVKSCINVKFLLNLMWQIL